MKNSALVILFIVLSLSLEGQGYFQIQKRDKPTRVKKLNGDRLYTITTRDTVYESTIIGCNDSALIIITKGKKYGVQMSIKRYPNPNANDTTFYRLYKKDTCYIPYNTVLSLKKDLIKNRHNLEIFGYIAVGGVLSLILVPVLAITESQADAAKSATISGVMLGISLPVIFIATRKTKYNMRDTWRFKGVK